MAFLVKEVTWHPGSPISCFKAICTSTNDLSLPNEVTIGSSRFVDVLSPLPPLEQLLVCQEHTVTDAFWM